MCIISLRVFKDGQNEEDGTPSQGRPIEADSAAPVVAHCRGVQSVERVCGMATDDGQRGHAGLFEGASGGAAAERGHGMKRQCAIYARYSCDLQRASSIEDQTRRCREYAARQDWHIVEDFVIADRELSGASIAGRAGLQLL